MAARRYWQQVNVATPHADMVSGAVALEVQHPWSDLLLSRRKSVETRTYPFPPWLIGERIHVLQSPPGTPGVSAVPDEVYSGDTRFPLAGWIVVGECFRYESRQSWESDAARHCIPTDEAGAYGWSDEREIYGWVIESAGANDSTEQTLDRSLHRVHRSFFAAPSEADVQRAEVVPPTAPPVDAFAAHGPLEMLAQRMRASSTEK